MPHATDQLEVVLERIRQHRNFDFRNYKRATLKRRIERRMSDRGCSTYRAYIALLDREPSEFDALVASMLIKVTSFFRDEEIWQELSNRLVPALLAEKSGDDELRVWCAGCATGEEAFSIAMLIADALGPAYLGYPLKVFGTDVDAAAIATARRGVYTARQLEAVPRATLERWFTPVAEGHAVRKEIRRAVVFGVNNLVSDAPISRIDLILCRNVFIYLDAALQKRVLTRFHYALRREGALVLGRSELIPFAARLFQAEDLAKRIYRKDLARGLPLVAQDRLIGLVDDHAEVAPDAGPTDGATAGPAQFYRGVVDSLRAPVVATALDGTVTAWNPAAAKLWARAEGDVAGRRLATLGLAGLSDEAALQCAVGVRDGSGDHATVEASIETSDGAAAVHVRVEVAPLRDEAQTLAGLVYVVSDQTAMRALETDLRRVNEEIRAANERLVGVNEEMRASNEELETTNEELQSANEELQTTNEELQSTNEELETTNEELQSANSELDATNRELAHRTEELDLLALHQRTMIRSLSAAVVVLDARGRITSWNLAAERLLGMPATEALGQTLWTLRVPSLPRSLIARVRRALGERRAFRSEGVVYALPAGAKGHATVAAVPLIEDETVLGAVMLFEDITRAVALAAENRALKSRRVAAAPRVAKKRGR